MSHSWKIGNMGFRFSIFGKFQVENEKYLPYRFQPTQTVTHKYTDAQEAYDNHQKLSLKNCWGAIKS